MRPSDSKPHAVPRDPAAEDSALAALVERHRSGDPSALNALMVEIYPSIHRIVFRLAGARGPRAARLGGARGVRAPRGRGPAARGGRHRARLLDEDRQAPPALGARKADRAAAGGASMSTPRPMFVHAGGPTEDALYDYLA